MEGEGFMSKVQLRSDLKQLKRRGLGRFLQPTSRGRWRRFGFTPLMWSSCSFCVALTASEFGLSDQISDLFTAV